MPSDFNEFLLIIPKQGCWPHSKMLAKLNNQLCTPGATEGTCLMEGTCLQEAKTSSLNLPLQELVPNHWALQRGQQGRQDHTLQG